MAGTGLRCLCSCNARPLERSVRLSPARVVTVLLLAGIALVAADRLTPDFAGRSMALASSDGGVVDPLDFSSTATVFIFTRADCPVSNRYAPEVRRLHGMFANRGVSFWLVYPDPDATLAQMQSHLREYEYPCAGLLDPRHELVDVCSAQMTPEAVVFLRRGAMVYRGRIDDRHVALGVARSSASVRDLEDVLTAVVEGRAVEPRTTKAVGCFIADLRK